MRYEVSLIGGPLSGPSFRESYLPGETYHYSADDAEYVEVLRQKGRFEIKEIADEPKVEPKADQEPKQEPAEAKAPAKGKGK